MMSKVMYLYLSRGFDVSEYIYVVANSRDEV